ncbi:hypothetical protein [Chryseobacterium sp. R2ACT005]|uniref:hypothetical protein n=1 Tax=Chryseobacterium sp. R2ACT005 TaxID=3416668 RepID=UPI003CF61104
MKTIYNSIREEVVKHSKVRNSVLGNVNEWKRSHYIILSEIIKDELSEAEELKGGKNLKLEIPFHMLPFSVFLKMITRIKPIMISGFLKH